MSRAALVRGAFTTLALVAFYQLFFQFEFVHANGLNVLRIDRFTATSCFVRLPRGAFDGHRELDPTAFIVELKGPGDC